MVTWLLWIRLDSGLPVRCYVLWFFLLRTGQYFPNSDFFFTFFFKSFFQGVVNPRATYRMPRNYKPFRFSIIYSKYINFWWWSWSFCIPQWPMQPSLTHHRLISHVNCFLKTKCSLQLETLKEKLMSPVHPSHSLFPSFHWCQFCASTKNWRNSQDSTAAIHVSPEQMNLLFLYVSLLSCGFYTHMQHLQTCILKLVGWIISKEMHLFKCRVNQ